MAVSAGRKPFLVMGEGIAGPLMAACLRTKGLNAHLLCTEKKPRTIDGGSIVLPPDVTHFLTEDLGLAGVRPPGNQVSNFYSYDNRANVLMNLNLDSLRPDDDGGTFFACQRSVIENLLIKECDRVARYLEHKNPVKVLRNMNLVHLQHGKAGRVAAQFSNGQTTEYQAVINTSRDMSAVPLLKGHSEEAARKRKDILSMHSRAQDISTAFFECTIPIPKDWELSNDELAEITHRQPKRLWIRPTSGRDLTVCLTVPLGLAFTPSNVAQHFSALMKHWSNEREPMTHALWRECLVPALQEAVSNASCKRVDYKTPTYCLDDWLEEDGKIIRIAGAAHGANAQPIDVADAIDFEDCFSLADFLGQSDGEVSPEDLQQFADARRAEAVEEVNNIALLDEVSFKRRGKIMYSLHRTSSMWTKSQQRNWKRTLRPFCSREHSSA